MKNIELEYYRKLRTEYEMDINNLIGYEAIKKAKEKDLINFAITDAINYYEELKKEQP